MGFGKSSYASRRAPYMSMYKEYSTESIPYGWADCSTCLGRQARRSIRTTAVDRLLLGHVKRIFPSSRSLPVLFDPCPPPMIPSTSDTLTITYHLLSVTGVLRCTDRILSWQGLLSTMEEVGIDSCRPYRGCVCFGRASICSSVIRNHCGRTCAFDFIDMLVSLWALDFV